MDRHAGGDPAGGGPGAGEDVRGILERDGAAIRDSCDLVAGAAGEDAFELVFETIGHRLPLDRAPARAAAWPYAVTRYILQRAGPAQASPPTGLADDVRDALGALDVPDRLTAALHARSDLADSALAEAFRHPATRADRAEIRAVLDRVDRYLGALLVARRRRRNCEVLAGLLVGWDGHLSTLTTGLRETVADHVDGCATCRAGRMLLVGPTGARGALRLLAATPPSGLAVETVRRVLDQSLRGGPPDPAGGVLAAWRDPGWTADGWPPPSPPLRSAPPDFDDESYDRQPRRDDPPAVLPPPRVAHGATAAEPRRPRRNRRVLALRAAGVVLTVLVAVPGMVALAHQQDSTPNTPASIGPTVTPVTQPSTVIPTSPDSLSPTAEPSDTPSATGPSPVELPTAAFELTNPALDFGESETTLTTTLTNRGRLATGVADIVTPSWLTIKVDGQVAAGRSTVITASVDRSRVPNSFYQSVLLQPTVAGGESVMLVVFGNGAISPPAFSAAPDTLVLDSDLTGKVTITNTGQRPSGVVVRGALDLQVTAAEPPLGPGQSTTLTITADPAKLPAGSFTRQLRVEPSAGGFGASLTVAGSVEPPVAELAIEPQSGLAPLTVTADASASRPGSAALKTYTFRWDSGAVTSTEKATAPHEYKTSARHQVTVEITDAAGHTAVSSKVTVTVRLPAPAMPEARLADDEKNWMAGAKVDFSWKEVTGAKNYVVEQQCCEADSWATRPTPDTVPEVSVDLKIDAPGSAETVVWRWRVYAVADDDTEGEASLWQDYKVARPRAR